PFTAWTTRVSNPVRSPRFRSSASVTAQRPAFATGVPPDICAFHRYTSNSRQRSHPTYYRGCWHVVGRCFFSTYRQSEKTRTFVDGERGLQPEGRHPPRGVAASGLRPLCNIPHCCLP